ncbi:hypothetical protein JXA85_01570 [Candidatus Woesearchaeota archaeon]|nr:hypothetical protein [Candidatus Woesearchaeota archaeon]
MLTIEQLSLTMHYLAEYYAVEQNPLLNRPLVDLVKFCLEEIDVQKNKLEESPKAAAHESFMRSMREDNAPEFMKYVHRCCCIYRI